MDKLNQQLNQLCDQYNKKYGHLFDEYIQKITSKLTPKEKKTCFNIHKIARRNNIRMVKAEDISKEAHKLHNRIEVIRLKIIQNRINQSIQYIKNWYNKKVAETRPENSTNYKTNLSYDISHLTKFLENQWPYPNHPLRARTIIEALLLTHDPLKRIQKQKETIKKNQHNKQYKKFYPDDRVYTKIAYRISKTYRTDKSSMDNYLNILKIIYHRKCAKEIVKILNLVYPY